MAKKIVKKLKFQLPAGKAVPGQQIGPALGQAGINIGEFVTKFNEMTRAQMGDMVTAEVLVYEDRSFGFNIKTPPTTSLILKAIGIEKGSGKNLVSKAGTITKAQIRAIAEKKLPDLNANNIEAAMKIIEGSCRSMGIDVKG